MADLLPVFAEEDAMASQIFEIVEGIRPKPLQTLEEPCNETDAWSMEEGDDSVFYSDEDTPQPQVAILETRRRVNSEVDETPLQEDDQEEKNNKIVHCSTQEKEKMDIEQTFQYENPKTTITEILVRAQAEDSQSIKINSAVKTSSKDLTNFSSTTKITSEPVAANQMSDTYHHKSEKTIQSQIQDGSQDSSEGQAFTALSKKKSSHPKSFNHLTSSKYSTLSYRRIRRGNTRQKIEEFEYMIMNL